MCKEAVEWLVDPIDLDGVWCIDSDPPALEVQGPSDGSVKGGKVHFYIVNKQRIIKLFSELNLPSSTNSDASLKNDGFFPFSLA